MDITNNDKISEQYSSKENLILRLNIHDKYSTNTYGWHKWIFDRFDFKNNKLILELGCGDATLWKLNINRLPQNCSIFLSDIYEGMLKEAKIKLSANLPYFQFEIIDAMQIPFENETFDSIIANGVLYHIPNIDLALGEIKRVLKKGGKFYTTTMGNSNFKELIQIVESIDNTIYFPFKDVFEKFGLESGENLLKIYFDNIKTCKYSDSLQIPEISPILDYLKSSKSINNIDRLFEKDKLIMLVDKLNSIINIKGSINIQKDYGMLIAQK